MEKRTIAIDCKFSRRDAYDSLSMPIYHTAAYEFDNAAAMSDAFCGRVEVPDYSRVMNPTVKYFEDKVKAITNAANVVALNSGMAAISNTLLALASQGKNIVTSKHLFGNTYALITKSLARFGVEVRLVDLTNLDAVDKAVDANTCCLFLEIVTNPQMEVADLQAISNIVHKKNVPLVADSTIIPFTRFSAHKLGVDIEVVSSTKYVSGGATSLGGLVIDYGAVPEFSERIKGEMLFNFGAYMTPHVAYMQSLGLELLETRYAALSSNAQQLAERLRTLPQIKRVNYNGLPDNPFHEIAKRQFNDTYGAMITIDLADEQSCYRFIDRLKLVRRATNLFDNKTLAIHPASTIFGTFSDDQKRSMDVFPTTIRLSVGLEAIDDIFNDIKQALQ